MTNPRIYRNSTMTDYTLSFVFNPEVTRVLLIKKNRPEALAGNWNGIGGKLDPNEDTYDGALRELREEANIGAELKHLAEVEINGSVIYCFYGISKEFDAYQTMTDEVVRPMGIQTLLEFPLDPDASWLIMLALANIRGSYERDVEVIIYDAELNVKAKV